MNEAVLSFCAFKKEVEVIEAGLYSLRQRGRHFYQK